MFGSLVRKFYLWFLETWEWDVKRRWNAYKYRYLSK